MTSSKIAILGLPCCGTVSGPCHGRETVAQRGCAIVGLLLVFATALADERPTAKSIKPKPANRLARETSPYLLMHAHNPVDWHPWGPEAFAKAKKENKLVFLSIGYSSCYWCHVMERQSFDNADVAKMMNDGFVCIKVDREERPDVDSIYMTSLQVQGQRGGWPLSMFLTPDGKPIAGGTYWPPDDREIEGEKVRGFKSILKVVREDWEKRPDALRQHADRVATYVQAQLSQQGRRLLLTELNRDLVKEAITATQEQYDSVHGGFGSSARQFRGPKFPTPPVLDLLLTEHLRSRDESLLKMLSHTLDRIAMGGIYDHVGGGFHRYSVDREWKVPHFEKMLYDNAQLVSLYSRAYQLTKKPLYRRVVEETLEFIGREMTSPQGAFYSALDAETDAEEGKFYVWTATEIDKLLPKPDAELVKKIYGVNDGPNFEGKHNVLLLRRPLADLAGDSKISEEELAARLRPLKRTLLEARNKRTRPFLDTKVLTGWNGLMIAGYADAGRALDNSAYIQAAERAADFVLANLRAKDGRLLRSYSAAPGGKAEAKLNGYLEDYSFLVHGLLSLHDATGSKKWLDEASRLSDQMVQLFHDKEQGGFFFTSHDHEKLFARSKEQYDSAIPSGNSIAALNFARLAAKTGDNRYRKQAEETLKAFAGAVKNNPGGMTAMARALSIFLEGAHAAPSPKPSRPEGESRAREDDPFETDRPPSKKPDPVKLSATVSPEKPGADGKQRVTIVMEVDKGWHAYANPAGNDSLIPTTVQINAKVKPEDVKIDYPKGKEMKDPALNVPVRVYEGKMAINATVRRGTVNGQRDHSPLEVSVRYQVCDDKQCLLPKTVKVKVGGEKKAK